MNIVLFALLAMTVLVTPAFASGEIVLRREFTIRDAVDGANFAPTHTAARSGHLSIGFESGTNLTTFTSRAFLATTSGAKTTAADVLVVRITAPAGFVIGTVSYEQVGTKTVSRQARVLSMLSWIVNGVPRVVASGPAPNATASVNLAANRLTKVEVSISPYLSAYLPTGGLGSGTIQITGAALNVTYVR
jgi:hypothetical protein